MTEPAKDLSVCQVNQLREDLSACQVDNTALEMKASTEHLSIPKVDLVVGPSFPIMTLGILELLGTQLEM